MKGFEGPAHAEKNLSINRTSGPLARIAGMGFVAPDDTTAC